jgi:zinc transporter 2
MAGKNIVKGEIMLIVAVMGLFFNLIQMRILHSGDGHYHLGGEDHDHDHAGHNHGHDHDHNHDHDHHHHDHAAKNKISDSSVKEPLVGINDEHNHEGGCDHDHDHDHDHHDHPHDRIAAEGEDNFINTGNMNVDAAFLHVMGDMLMSVGVIIAALIITWNPNWWYADPICTYLFSVIVFVTTVPIIKNCVKIIMEGTPKNISLEMLTNDILNLDKENIIDVHDLHVWQIAQGRNTMSAHLKSKKPMKTLAQVTDLARRKYNLHHTTVQVEGVEDFEANPHHFECGNDLHD